MPLFGNNYTGPSEVHYLFIDGGAFRGRIHAASADLSRRRSM
jgi:hypothetical protein